MPKRKPNHPIYLMLTDLRLTRQQPMIMQWCHCSIVYLLYFLWLEPARFKRRNIFLEGLLVSANSVACNHSATGQGIHFFPRCLEVSRWSLVYRPVWQRLYEGIIWSVSIKHGSRSETSRGTLGCCFFFLFF